MTSGPELKTALDAAYAVFAPYRRPTAFEAAPHRKPEALLATLTAEPLRQVPCEAIGPYAGWAVTTVGDVDDYKHFLPRILEVAIDQTCPHMGCEPEILGSRIAYAGFTKWPAKERDAIVAVFEAAWTRTLAEPPDHIDAETWIMGMAALDLPLGWRLERWLTMPEINPGLHLADAVCAEARRRAAPRSSSMSETSHALAYRAWLGGPKVAARLENLRPEVPSEEIWRVDQALRSSLASH